MRATTHCSATKTQTAGRDYETTFSHRGRSYDVAMQCYPDARRREFEQAVSAVAILPGMVVADVPSGGGYIGPYLPHDCICLRHEPCSSFAASGKHSQASPSTSLLPLPWHSEQIDVAISIAGVHHMVDKRPFLSDLHRVTKPGGYLVLSDVAAGTPQAHFLDGFVGLHNSTGHTGEYLDQTTEHMMEETEWNVVSDHLRHYHWTFDSIHSIAQFCRLLFDLADLSDWKIISAVDQKLGIDAISGGGIGMRWALRTITCRKE